MPFGVRSKEPFAFVVLRVFPSRVRLSTSKEVRPLISVLVVPSEIALVPIVIELFAS